MPEACRSCCLGCPDRARSLFADLSPAEEQKLRAFREPRGVRKGEPVFSQGEPVGGIFCIGVGAVRVSQRDAGKTLLVRVAGPGDTVGHRSLFTRAEYRGTATALIDTSLCFLPKAAVLELLGSSPAFSLRLLRRMARDLELFEESQGALRTGTVDERLSLLLRQLAESHGVSMGRQGRRIELPLSRADLAAMMGVAEETVIRGLSRLRRRGLIAEENSRILLRNAAISTSRR